MGHQQRHPNGRVPDGLADRPPSSPEEREGQARIPRPWLQAGGVSLVVALGIGASAFLNPMLGRYVHWGRVGIGSPLVFAGLALAFRHRWI